MGSSTPSINLSIIANSAFESFTNTHSIPIKLPRTFKMDVGDSLVYCPVYAPFFGAMGCTSAIVFTCFGAAYGTAKSGVGICAMGVLRPDLIVKNIVPVIMAGLAAGFAIGIVGDAGVRGTAQQPRLFVGMILI